MINDLLNKVKSLEITLDKIIEVIGLTFIGGVVLGFSAILLFSLIYAPMFFLFVSIFLIAGFFLGKFIVDSSNG